MTQYPHKSSGRQNLLSPEVYIIGAHAHRWTREKKKISAEKRNASHNKHLGLPPGHNIRSAV